MSKGEALLTLAHLSLHVNLSLCDLSCLGMSGPEPFDVGDDLTPHISFFMCVCGIFFGQAIPRATARRHVDGVAEWVKGKRLDKMLGWA